jgi:hypothetical protein
VGLSIIHSLHYSPDTVTAVTAVTAEPSIVAIAVTIAVAGTASANPNDGRLHGAHGVQQLHEG